MGLADWDVDAILRGALQATPNLEQIKDISERYDKTFDTAMASNIKIQDKYKHIYKLITK